MERPPPLPLSADLLPATVRRFGDPAAPGPARTMAAKGLVPVKGADLVTLLVQLAADPEQAIADAAASTLAGLPDGVLLSACEGELHPSILQGLARRFAKRDDVLDRVVQNRGVADATVCQVAQSCSEHLSETIAVNQERLLRAPDIVAALYKNKATRMSTADRMVELCARNGVEVKGIPAFAEHVEAIRGQLIPEASDEPLPSDAIFQEALDADDADGDVVDFDEEAETENLKEKFRPLQFRIREMNLAEKIRLAIVGDAAARAILVREPNKLVSRAAISSPSMTENEACGIAHSREVSDDVLRYIGNRKEWLRNYDVKKALVFNPKTPVGVSLRFVAHMRPNDLKMLAKSRNIPQPVKTAVRQRLEKTTKNG